MKKPDLSMQGSTHVPFQESDWSEAYPTLWEWLTAEKFDDGTFRTTASLLIFVQSGELKACINDRQFSRSAFLTAATVESLLHTLDEKLEADSLDWRVKSNNRSGGSAAPY